MTTKRTSLAAVAATGLLAATAWALQEGRKPAPNTPQDDAQAKAFYLEWTKPATRWQKVSDLIGKDVKHSGGEKLGEVQDLAIDPKAGRILYAVLSFGGVMGMGEKYFAIPLKALELPADAKHFILNVDKGKLKNAQGFDKSTWPNMADTRWARETHEFYGQTYYDSRDQLNETAPRPTAAWQKGTDLRGKKIQNPQGEDLGELEDVVVNPDNGRVLFGIVGFGGFMGMGEKWFAVPWSSLELTPKYEHFVLNVDRDRLKNAPGFDKKTWPNFASEPTSREIFVFYGKPVYWEEGRVESERLRKNDLEAKTPREP